MSNDSTSTAAIFEDLKSLTSIKELTKRAATLFGVNVTKDMDREAILKAVREKMNTSNFAIEAVGDAPKPGWARIMLHKIPGDSPRPLPAGVSGYTCIIPRNQKVDVPIKIYQALQTCKRQTPEQDDSEAKDSKNYIKFVESDAYPMTLYAITAGPDPRPGHDVRKEAMLRPYKAYLGKYGKWPHPRELRAAVAEGRLDGYKPSDVDAQVGVLQEAA